MKIVIRTRYINTFLVCFQSFNTFYHEHVPNVIAQVHDDIDTAAFKEAAKEFGFQVDVYQHDNQSGKNEWAEMLRRSLQYGSVLSIDDDLVFLEPGLLDLLENLRESTGAGLIGTRYLLPSGEAILHSHLLYSNGLTVSDKDFGPVPLMFERFEGVDTALLGQNHQQDLFYLDTVVPYYRDKIRKSFYSCKYYAHVGGVSCLWHKIHNAIV